MFVVSSRFIQMLLQVKTTFLSHKVCRGIPINEDNELFLLTCLDIGVLRTRSDLHNSSLFLVSLRRQSYSRSLLPSFHFVLKQTSGYFKILNTISNWILLLPAEYSVLASGIWSTCIWAWHEALPGRCRMRWPGAGDITASHDVTDRCHSAIVWWWTLNIFVFDRIFIFLQSILFWGISRLRSCFFRFSLSLWLRVLGIEFPENAWYIYKPNSG